MEQLKVNITAPFYIVPKSCGSMKFGFGSGSADPYPCLMDPDPVIFKIKGHKEITKQ
jgi:hypothetical protein